MIASTSTSPVPSGRVHASLHTLSVGVAPVLDLPGLGRVDDLDVHVRDPPGRLPGVLGGIGAADEQGS
jgi:hypothetical protein